MSTFIKDFIERERKCRAEIFYLRQQPALHQQLSSVRGVQLPLTQDRMVVGRWLGVTAIEPLHTGMRLFLEVKHMLRAWECQLQT